MADDWYYRLPGQADENGPIELESLRALADEGSIPGTALVREGNGAWRVASSVAALSEAGVADQAVEDVADSPMSLDDLGLKVVDEHPVAGADAATDDAPTPASLDDLGITVVDESPSARTPGTEQSGSRVLGPDDWTDPAQFNIRHAIPERESVDTSPEDDEYELDDDLRELAESALTGSNTNAKPAAKPTSEPAAKPAPSKPPAQTSPPSGEYFVKVDGTPHGPIAFETLKSWAQEGRVLEEDEIQLPGTEIWIPAGNLPVLFEGLAPQLKDAGSSPAAAPATSAPAAAPASQAPTPVGEAPATEEAATIPLADDPAPADAAPPSTPAPAAPAAPTPTAPPAAPTPHPAFATPSAGPAKKKAKIGKGPSAIGTWFSDLFSSLGSGGGEGMKQAGPVAIGVGVVAVLVLGWMYMPSFDNDSGTYATLVQAYEKSLSGADTATKDSVQKIVDELEKTASAKEPEKQRMLWAARDYLLPMLSAGKIEKGSETDAKFHEHMNAARTYFGEDAPALPSPPPSGDEKDGKK